MLKCEMLKYKNIKYKNIQIINGDCPILTLKGVNLRTYSYSEYDSSRYGVMSCIFPYIFKTL